MTSCVSGQRACTRGYFMTRPTSTRNGRREHHHVRCGDHGEKKVAGKSLWRGPRVGADRKVRIKDNPYGCQLRRGRTYIRAS